MKEGAMQLLGRHQLRLFLASSVVGIGIGCGPGGDGLGSGTHKAPDAGVQGSKPIPTPDWDAAPVDPGGFDAPICSMQAFMLRGKDPPDLLVVLDKSGSMLESFP